MTLPIKQPGRFDFNAAQGSARRFTFVLKASDSGDSLDLAGFLARGQIRSTAQSREVMAELTCTVAEPSTLGRVTVFVPASSLQGSRFVRGLNFGETYRATYDVELYDPLDPEGAVRVLHGFVYISPETTKEDLP